MDEKLKEAIKDKKKIQTTKPVVVPIPANRNVLIIKKQK